MKSFCGAFFKKRPLAPAGATRLRKRDVVLRFVDFAPDAGVFGHQIVGVLAVGEVGVGVDGGSDVDGVFLNGEAVGGNDVGVLHGDETGEDGDIALGGKKEGTCL